MERPKRKVLLIGWDAADGSTLLRYSVASQQTMISRLGTKAASLDPEQIERALRAHREDVRKWAQTAPHVEMLEMDYLSLVQKPAAAISRLVEFLGRERLPNEQRMAAVMEPAFHRQRR